MGHLFYPRLSVPMVDEMPLEGLRDMGARIVDICAVDDVPNGKHKAFVSDGQSVLLFNLNGHFHAIQNRCTHLDYPLEGGRQMGWEIICRQHGARFDIRTGRALCGPAIDPVRIFEVRVDAGRIMMLLPAVD